MKAKTLLQLAITAGTTLPIALSGAQKASKDSGKPNFLIVLLDDVGFSDFSCFGGPIPTPNIDALAQKGVRMSQMYNCARSCPTRAAILTGLYPQQAGVGFMTDDLTSRASAAYQGRLNTNCVTIGEVLGASGYFTAQIGKWHVCPNNFLPGMPPQRGFQQSITNVGGPSFFPGPTAKLSINGKVSSPGENGLPTEWYATDLWTDRALKYMDMAKTENKPFMIYLAETAAHFPLQAPEDEIRKFDGKFSVGWDSLRRMTFRRQREMNILGREYPLTPRCPLIPFWEDVDPAQKAKCERTMQIYAAMIGKVDDNVGRMVAFLKKNGLFDNTVIMVLCDNGANAEGESVFGTYKGANPGGVGSDVYLGQVWAESSNTPFFLYKHHTHEGGISTPFVVSYPAGIPAKLNGTIARQPGHVIDVMATLVAMSGATYPETFHGNSITPMQGINLYPVWLGGSVERKDPIFWEHEENVALRDGKWKIVKEVKDYNYQLYDMEADRTEMNDLSQKEPEVMKNMMAKFRSMYDRVGAMPLHFNKNLRWAIPVEDYRP